MSKKEYVKVKATFGTSGLIPSSVVWSENRQFEIERVLHICSSLDDGDMVRRYTVLIKGKQKYLYQDKNDRWYVNVAN